MVQISSVLIRETRVYPCPDFKLSGSQISPVRDGVLRRRPLAATRLHFLLLRRFRASCRAL